MTYSWFFLSTLYIQLLVSNTSNCLSLALHNFCRNCIRPCLLTWQHLEMASCINVKFMIKLRKPFVDSRLFLLLPLFFVMLVVFVHDVCGRMFSPSSGPSCIHRHVRSSSILDKYFSRRIAKVINR